MNTSIINKYTNIGVLGIAGLSDMLNQTNLAILGIIIYLVGVEIISMKDSK